MEGSRIIGSTSRALDRQAQGKCEPTLNHHHSAQVIGSLLGPRDFSEVSRSSPHWSRAALNMNRTADVSGGIPTLYNFIFWWWAFALIQYCGRAWKGRDSRDLEITIAAIFEKVHHLSSKKVDLKKENSHGHQRSGRLITHSHLLFAHTS